MIHRISPAVAAIAAACLAAPLGAFAQTAPADPPQAGAVAPGDAAAQASPPAAPAAPTTPTATQPSPQPPADSQAAPPESATAPSPAAGAPPQSAAADAAPSASGPLVGYMKHTKPPFMIDTTIAAAELGMIGAMAAMSSGHEIVTKNDIPDPSTEIARMIAVDYAAQQGGHVAAAPISDDQVPAKTRLEGIGPFAAGARYVVNVGPASLDIIYFVTDPLRRDVTLMSNAAIVDTSTGKVIAKGRCFIKQSRDGERYTHEQLLADQASALKSVIARKSQQCVGKLEAAMKIAPAAPAAPTA